MVLFGSGMSYGHSHGNANLPTILAGGKALGLKHGQHIDYNLPKIGKLRPGQRRRSTTRLCHTPVDGKARLTNLLLTMMQKMEVDAEQFVDSLGAGVGGGGVSGDCRFDEDVGLAGRVHLFRPSGGATGKG